MADDNHIAHLMEGAAEWSDYRRYVLLYLEGRTETLPDLREADLRWADLRRQDLRNTHLGRADLSGADLQAAILLEADLTGADLTGCRIYGIAAWDLKLERAKQQNLVITRKDEPNITVDNIEVAQFIYLLLHNEKIRDVIDTIGKKGVLLLGRFTEGRVQILERLREKLRGLGFVPMVFNFDKPETKEFHRDGPVARQSFPLRDCRHHQPPIGAA